MTMLALAGMFSAGAVSAVPDSARHLGEVTVTAIKQSADLRLEPIASTVVAPLEISRYNISTMKQVSELAPNFYIPDYGSRMTSTIYVRGLGARIDQSAVGLNVDNVAFLNKDAYDFELTDIERIEVLRGAQSSLYGRNTMAGQINIYTLSPLKYQGHRAVAEIGNAPDARISLSEYFLASQKVGMALTGNFNFSDGYYKNYYNSRKVGTDKSMNLRWKTEWAPNRRFTLNNVASFSLSRQSGYPYKLLTADNINYNDTCFYRRNLFSDGLTVKWNASGFTLSSITGFQYLDDNMTLDQDFTPLDIFTLTQGRHEWSLTQDVVIRGKKDKYSWLGGLFAFKKSTSMRAPVSLKEDGIAQLITDRVNSNPQIPVKLQWDEPINLFSEFRAPVWGIAAYHQGEIELGRWSLVGALRLDYEKTTLRYNSHSHTDFKVVMPGGREMPMSAEVAKVGSLSDHFLQLLPKFTVSYRLPMPGASDVYASFGKGYKSGGFNTQMFSDVLQRELMMELMKDMPNPPSVSEPYSVSDIISYKPEKSWNYEVGTHVACADGRVNCDLALFYVDCRNQQLTMFPKGTTTGRITANAPKSRMWGAEAQIRFAPTSRWSFRLNYGYANAKFVDFEVQGTDYHNKHVPYAPEHTLFGSATYRQPLPWNLHALEITSSVRGVGRIYWNEENSASQPFYAQLAISATACFNWADIELWTENITGTKFNVFYFKSMGNDFVQRGKPFRYGATIRFRFDS